MSWYNTVVLSFSSDEYDDDSPPRVFEPLRNINAWLKQHDFEKLADLTRGKLGSNAVLFGGCYNRLDVASFCECIQSQSWKCQADVQVLFWSDYASKFEVIQFPIETEKSKPKKRSKGAVKRSSRRR